MKKDEFITRKEFEDFKKENDKIISRVISLIDQVSKITTGKR